MHKVFLTTLLLSLASLFFVLIFLNNNLQIITCDVGQGDAILIQQGSIQVLIDGGPDDKVIDCLDQYIPFWDRSIELIVITHPQKDHYGGLIKVLENYKVNELLVSGLTASSLHYQVLQTLVGGSAVKIHNASRVEFIRLGLMQLEVLHPDRGFVNANSKEKNQEEDVLGEYQSDLDPNQFSVCLLLTYKNFDAIFTGDIDQNISNLLVKKFENNSNMIEYLKVPHHGSKNGMTKKLLDVVNPKLAVISAGRKNKYGHPHKEIIEMIRSSGIKLLGTYDEGNVVVESDGASWWIN